MISTNIKNQSGQALVPLLIFVMVAIAVSASATYILASNSISVTNLSLGIAAKQEAESGAEKALLQLLRDPNYRGEKF